MVDAIETAAATTRRAKHATDAEPSKPQYTPCAVATGDAAIAEAVEAADTIKAAS